jgi:hypothetical protein
MLELPKIDSFQAALEFYSFAKMFKDDLPDGQYEDLKEIVQGYIEDYGRKPSEWSEDIKEAFTEDMAENYLYWL